MLRPQGANVETHISFSSTSDTGLSINLIDFLLLVSFIGFGVGFVLWGCLLFAAIQKPCWNHSLRLCRVHPCSTFDTHHQKISTS